MNLQPLGSKNTTTIQTADETAPTKAEQRELTGAEKSQANKQKINASIIQSQFEMSLKSDDKSLSLLYKSVITSMAKEFEDYIQAATEGNKSTDKIANPYGNDTDTSPKATADRILSFATGFYETFKKQNPNLSQQDSLDQFMKKIGAGIEQGFGEARDILTSINRLEGKVKTDIDETYELIQKGLQAFRESFNKKDDDEQSIQPVRPTPPVEQIQPIKPEAPIERIQPAKPELGFGTIQPIKNATQ